MEGGNTREYANLVQQSDEYGNPIGENMDVSGRKGLSTNVGHASGGAGCHYDFGDTTGGFGVAGVYLNQLIGGDGKEKGRSDETRDKKETVSGGKTDEERTTAVAVGGVDNKDDPSKTT